MVAVLAKTLTETDLGDSFEVPADWLPVLPPFGPDPVNYPTQLWVTDGLGFFWEFWYVMLPVEYCLIDGVKYYARTKAHLHAEEWLKFVFSKGLKAEDRVVLDKEDDKFRQTKYSIRAQKLDSDGDKWIDV